MTRLLISSQLVSNIETMLPNRIRLQRLIGHIFFIPICGPVILLIKYRLKCSVEDLQAIRQYYKEIRKDKTPLLICSNHLTYVDSVIIIYALANHWWYFFNFKHFTWNLPAMEYKKNPTFRFICYFSKCIFINRSGTKEHHHHILETARSLLKQGEVITIFPEGRRSQTGRFDQKKLAYGIGKIISELDECRVLCVYVRSMTQEAKSNFPKTGSQFKLKSELIYFNSAQIKEGTPATLTHAIADRIQNLEDTYFTEMSAVKAPLPAYIPIATCFAETAQFKEL